MRLAQGGETILVTDRDRVVADMRLLTGARALGIPIHAL